MSKDTPAFPHQPKDSAGAPMHEAWSGLTKRQWYAGMALPAIVAATSAGQHHPGNNLKSDDKKTLPERMAFDAFELADAMMAIVREESE